MGTRNKDENTKRFKVTWLCISGSLAPRQHGTKSPWLLGVGSWGQELVVRQWVISSGEQIKVQKEKTVSGHIALTPAQGARTEAYTQVQGGTRYFMRTGCSVWGQQVQWDEPLPCPP